MKILSALLALTLALTPNSRADYGIPEMSVGLKVITDILDVEVTGIDDKGIATIQVLKAYKSSEPPVKRITRTHLACFPMPPGKFGMKSGQRYIVMLVKDALYEEGSFFPVKVEGGITQCKPRWYGGKTWLNTKGEWITLEEFEAKITAALKVEEAKFKNSQKKPK